MATHNNMTKRFNFFISDEEDQLLENLANEQNISKGELVRQLLNREKIRRSISDPFIIGLEIYEFCKEKITNETQFAD